METNFWLRIGNTVNVWLKNVLLVITEYATIQAVYFPQSTPLIKEIVTNTRAAQSLQKLTTLLASEKCNNYLQIGYKVMEQDGIGITKNELEYLPQVIEFINKTVSLAIGDLDANFSTHWKEIKELCYKYLPEYELDKVRKFEELLSD